MDAWDGSFEYEPFLLLLFGDPFFASLKIAQSRDQSWKRGAEVAEAMVQTETAHSCITKDDNGSRRKTWSISPLFFLYLFRWLGILDDFGMFLQTRIPVTVLTGGLGAGKTTLLKCHSQAFNGLQNGTWCWKLLGRHWSLPRHILENPHGYRIAVIQNEPAPQNGWLESCVESLALLEHLRFSEEMGMEALPYRSNIRRSQFTDLTHFQGASVYWCKGRYHQGQSCFLRAQRVWWMFA